MAKKEILNNDVATVRVNVEPVTDVVEHAIDILEESAQNATVVVRNNPYLLFGVAVVAGAIGAFAGYKYAQHRLTTVFDARMSEEVERTKEFYSTLHKKGDLETPEGAAEAFGIDPVLESAVEAIESYQQGSESVRTEKPKYRSVSQERRNIFSQIPEWDQDFEEHTRASDPTAPYVISKEEFLENEHDHEQTTLTYFKGDDVVADNERDTVVDDTTTTVGDANLLRFGHGSGDPNVVYIRNETLEHDWEVLYSDGKYAKMVLGFDAPEIKHSGRRFRGDRRLGE